MLDPRIAGAGSIPANRLNKPFFISGISGIAWHQRRITAEAYLNDQARIVLDNLPLCAVPLDGAEPASCFFRDFLAQSTFRHIFR